MGRIEPSGALVARIRVFAIEMPTALTASPKRMAPKPQMRPVATAISSARPGAAARICEGMMDVQNQHDRRHYDAGDEDEDRPDRFPCPARQITHGQGKIPVHQPGGDRQSYTPVNQ